MLLTAQSLISKTLMENYLQLEIKDIKPKNIQNTQAFTRLINQDLM